MSMEYKNLGYLPEGVQFQGGLRKADQLLRFYLYNFNHFPLQLNSKHQFCGVIVSRGVEVTIKDTMDRHKRSKIMQSEVVQCNSLEDYMTQRFPIVLSSKLGCVTHYDTPYLKFKGEVPLDGGRQFDFSGAAKPTIAKKVAKWMQLGVVDRVERQLACISLLIMVLNNGKPGFRICHDLHMLNAAAAKEWGPTMDKMARLQGISGAELFSVLDLTKGFMQISIQKSDQRYFGFYFDGSFFCFKRLPFGFVNSM